MKKFLVKASIQIDPCCFETVFIFPARWSRWKAFLQACRTTFVVIFTGFGLLESGSVSSKNEVNIMVKNAADVIFGGLSYWAFGYAISFGKHER